MEVTMGLMILQNYVLSKGCTLISEQSRNYKNKKEIIKLLNELFIKAETNEEKLYIDKLVCNTQLKEEWNIR